MSVWIFRALFFYAKDVEAWRRHWRIPILGKNKVESPVSSWAASVLREAAWRSRFWIKRYLSKEPHAGKRGATYHCRVWKPDLRTYVKWIKSISVQCHSDRRDREEFSMERGLRSEFSWMFVEGTPRKNAWATNCCRV